LIFISVVSHGHLNFLDEINVLPKLSKHSNVKVVVLDNINELGLKEWCYSHGITYLVNKERKGFGTNNNLIFNYIDSNFTVNNDDYFLVLNPDVFIDIINFELLVKEVIESAPDVCTIDLFKDYEYQIRDPFIRKFPRFYDFFASYLLGVNNTVIDRSTTEVDFIDWCAGSFICFKIETYKCLKGFDEGYFMYCEDIDICFRAMLLNINIHYFPEIKAVHLAQHTNRSFLSKHFVWHVKSIIRFLLKTNRIFQIKSHSSIK
jgi:N-acetylglucosaminyl-diphospho-decaprenol L-rhamnosyltransferase